jgi:demethylmenaquinone methyltransferase/2-methoxy-6-polyprenyl-1,4-benzoquinol methylase
MTTTESTVENSPQPLPPTIQGPQADKIKSMFSEISEGYDLANTILSAGIHHLWRKTVVKWSGAQPGDRVLDCATGTGDLAIAFKKTVGSLGQVVGTDFCAEMMKPAPAKAARKKLDITFEQADVTRLPYENDAFDISSISFGIRNVQDPLKGVSELARVVRPGGAVMILEFGQPTIPGIQQAYNYYSRKVLPYIGGLITGRRQAYEYLQNSSEKFPCGKDFAAMMRKTGQFAAIDYRPLSLGIAYIYKGVVK